VTRYSRPSVSAEFWRIEVRDGELLLFDKTVPRTNFSVAGIEAAMVALQLAYRPPGEILDTFAKPTTLCRREPPTVFWSPDGATCGTTPTVTLKVVAEMLTVAPERDEGIEVRKHGATRSEWTRPAEHDSVSRNELSSHEPNRSCRRGRYRHP